MNIFTATKTLTFVAKLFAAAKLNLDEFVTAGDETALAAHIAAQSASAAPATPALVAAAPIAPDTAAVETNLLKNAGIAIAAGQTPAQALAAYVTAHTTLDTRHGSLMAALGKAGVKITAETKPEEFGAAIDSRVSTKAGEELAKRGLKDFVEQEVTPDPTKASAKIDASLTGLARVEAALRAENR